MKSGQMRQSVQLQRAAANVNGYGTPVSVFATYATLRAELVELKAGEAPAGGGGTVAPAAIVLRVRFLDGVRLSDRVLFRSESYAIRAVLEIEAGRGLEISCDVALYEAQA